MTISFYLVPKRTKNLYCRLSDGKDRKTFSLGYSVPTTDTKLSDQEQFVKAGIHTSLSKLEEELTSFDDRTPEDTDTLKRFDLIHQYADTLLSAGLDKLIYLLFELAERKQTIGQEQEPSYTLSQFEKAFQQAMPSAKSYSVGFDFVPTFTLTDESETTFVVFTREYLNRKIRQRINQALDDDLSVFLQTIHLQTILDELSVSTAQIVEHIPTFYKQYWAYRERTEAGSKFMMQFFKTEKHKSDADLSLFLSVCPFISQGQFVHHIKEHGLIWPFLVSVFRAVGDRPFLDRYLDLVCQQPQWTIWVEESQGVNRETYYVGNLYDIWQETPEPEPTDHEAFYSTLLK